LPTPINFRNLILSSFVFLFRVISFTIFIVDSLNLKGRTTTLFFSLDRYRDSESESLSEGSCLRAVLTAGDLVLFLRVFYLISNCK
jgi:hypothetical protein